MKYVLAAGGMVAVLTYSIALIARADVVQSTFFGDRTASVCSSSDHAPCKLQIITSVTVPKL
jgi:hypothetical protein